MSKKSTLTALTAALLLAGTASAQNCPSCNSNPCMSVERKQTGGFIHTIEKGNVAQNYVIPRKVYVKDANGCFVPQIIYETHQGIAPTEHHTVDWEYDQSYLKCGVDFSRCVVGTGLSLIGKGLEKVGDCLAPESYPCPPAYPHPHSAHPRPVPETYSPSH